MDGGDFANNVAHRHIVKAIELLDERVRLTVRMLAIVSACGSLLRKSWTYIVTNERVLWRMGVVSSAEIPLRSRVQDLNVRICGLDRLLEVREAISELWHVRRTRQHVSNVGRGGLVVS